ncbi:MAG: M15 family metallopeptidase [bacterium]
MKRKLRLKKEVKFFLVITFSLISIYYIYDYDLNKKEQEQYEATYEYRFTEKGYSKDDVQKLLNNFNNDMLESFLIEDYNENIILLLEQKYYISNYFYKYLEYMEKEKIPVEEVITYVNLGLYEEFYENVKEIDVSTANLMLVNKYYKLPEGYAPSNLESVSSGYSWGDYGSQKLISEVYEAFLEMATNCKNEQGITLMVSSSYRSYETQESLYNAQMNAYGVYYADTVAARPGHSEHETGYALDILSLEWSVKNDFNTSKTYAWLIANSHKYGFILRYPEGKEDITGFEYEPWHYRYVGKEVAEYMYNNNITFDEYYAYFLEN